MSKRDVKRAKSQRAEKRLPLAARLEVQRTRVFKAMGIVEACRLGSDSMLAPLNGADEADFGDALAAAHDLLDDVADELERIGKTDDGEHPASSEAST